MNQHECTCTGACIRSRPYENDKRAKNLVPFNIQPLFDLVEVKVFDIQKVMDILRHLWIRSTSDKNDEEYVLKNKAQRRIIACVLADLARSSCLSGSSFINYDVLQKTMRALYLDEYIKVGGFMVAGGFLLRMVENPDMDPLAIAEKHDIDIFVNNSNVDNVSNWLATLRANGVRVQQVERPQDEKCGRQDFCLGLEQFAMHNLYRIHWPSKVVPSTGDGHYASGHNMPNWGGPSFLVQFSRTECRDIYELMENFDLPMCQIGINTSVQCVTSFAFHVVQKYKKDAIISVSNAIDGSKRVIYEKRRLDKYCERGYHLHVVDGLTYYGYSRFEYGEGEFGFGIVDRLLAAIYFGTDKKQKTDDLKVVVTEIIPVNASEYSVWKRNNAIGTNNS